MRELAEVFAVGVYAFAWMSNHFHLALAVRAWSDDEVVERWQRIYRSKCEKANAERRAQMLADPVRMQLIRERQASLSWFMKCLNEHVSRIANREDQAHGHFWEARFKRTGVCPHPLIARFEASRYRSNVSGAARRTRPAGRDGERLLRGGGVFSLSLTACP